MSFHSISFPSEWGPQADGWKSLVSYGFHSISFPSEWGQIITFTSELLCNFKVSIQLVSPASGDPSI